MADTVSQVALAGSVSLRNVDTVAYRVTAELPRAGLPKPGERFLVWPWGSAIGWIVGRGPVVKNDEIAAWAKAGLIERIG